MKHAHFIAVGVLLAVLAPTPSHAQPVRELINQAIAAEGGIDALRALGTLSIKVDAMHWEPGQSRVAGGEPRFLGVSTLAITWDLANGSARTEWDRAQKNPGAQK